jgi:hypothetical protein
MCAYMLVRIYNPCRRKSNIFVHKILVSNTGQYLYDANAYMTYDPSKKITVSYNPLNLPRLVEFDNNDFIEYPRWRGFAIRAFGPQHSYP